MRLSVDHRTTYRFTAPQGRLVQLLRMTPEDTLDQSVTGWRLHVDVDARLREHRDGFGNRVTMLYVDGPVTSLELSVAGEILTNPSNGVVHGTYEPLPPALFARATPCTTADDALAAFARAVALGDDIERLHALNAAIHRRFAPATGRGPIRSASDAFADETATPRDLAHVFVAAARVVGVPARYVSGYRLADGGGSALAPHGWAEAHVAALGWVAFDPSTGLCADERYARVAVALDAMGAAAVAGSRMGEGEEHLDVDLRVDEGREA